MSGDISELVNTPDKETEGDKEERLRKLKEVL